MIKNFPLSLVLERLQFMGSPFLTISLGHFGCTRRIRLPEPEFEILHLFFNVPPFTSSCVLLPKSITAELQGYP